MSQPLVSVLVPIYNVEKYIERCARSIFEQAYENLEIIFVNDCTPDNSVGVLRKVLAEYPNRIAQTQIINHEKNLGLAGARLTGLKTSTGKYIQNIDSDDYIDKNMISDMVALAEQENADITICDFMYVYDSNTHFHKQVNPPLDNLICLKKVLLGDVHSSLWNKLIKRNLFVYNEIHSEIGLNVREDFSVMYKLLYKAERLSYIPDPLYFYSQENAGSYIRGGYNRNSMVSSISLIENMQQFELVNNLPQDIKQLFHFMYTKLFCEYLLCSPMLNNQREFYNLVKEYGLRCYLGNPMLPIYYQAVGAFYKLRLKAIAYVVRVCYQTAHRVFMERKLIPSLYQHRINKS